MKMKEIEPEGGVRPYQPHRIREFEIGQFWQNSSKTVKFKVLQKSTDYRQFKRMPWNGTLSVNSSGYGTWTVLDVEHFDLQDAMMTARGYQPSKDPWILWSRKTNITMATN